MKALDTNIIVRFLVNDDEIQGRRVRGLFKSAQTDGAGLFITTPVLLELIWVLSAVYDFRRDEVVRAVDLLAQMPILAFEDFAIVEQWIQLSRSTRADLSDLLIGLTAQSHGCDATLTFEKGLAKTGLFGQL